MAATMQDVADRAGVSIATVSFVVNNTKRVTPETRARIEQAMHELDFRRNLLARALASRRTRIVALVLAAVDRGIHGTSSDFMVGAAREAHEADHHLVVYPDDVDGSQLPALVGHGLVDGVVLMEVQMDDPRVALLTGLDVPFSLIGRTADTTGLYCVDIDFDASMQIAVDHLVDLGHRRIVYMPSVAAGAELLGRIVRAEAAYRRLMKKLRRRPIVLSCPPTVAGGRQNAIELAARAPGATAVVIAGEAAAAGFIAELRRRQIGVPGDLSVVALLVSEELVATCDPPLTSVASPGGELGRLGVQALLHRLAGDPPSEPVLRAGVLVLGESTGPLTKTNSRLTHPASSAAGAGGRG